MGTVVSRLLFRKIPMSPLLENICIEMENKTKFSNCLNESNNIFNSQCITFLLRGRALNLCIESPSCFRTSVVIGLCKSSAVPTYHFLM